LPHRQHDVLTETPNVLLHRRPALRAPLHHRPLQQAIRGHQRNDHALIENWNSVVQRDDTIWVLGDFAHDRIDPRIARRIFQQLRGSKHLIRGNHDGRTVESLPWSSVRDYAEIAFDKQRLVLSHYSMRSWNAMRRGAVQLYGHSHGRLPGTTQCLDVGVDAWDFRPVSFPEIRQRLAASPMLWFRDQDDVVEALEIGDRQPAAPGG
jgi:calcineurin-like phosphoesterase family protein